MRLPRGGVVTTCDGISRRNFLELGARSLGLGLADVLRSRAARGQPRQASGTSR